MDFHCIREQLILQLCCYLAALVHDSHSIMHNDHVKVFCPVVDTGGLQVKPPLKIARVPNLFTIHVGDKITKSYA